MTIEEAIRAELNKGIHAQLTDLINKAVRKGYDMAMAELIHCKDCKHYRPMVEMCGRHPVLAYMGKDGDGFCNLAERKEE